MRTCATSEGLVAQHRMLGNRGGPVASKSFLNSILYPGNMRKCVSPP